MKVDDLSTVVIRVFDMKCIGRDWHSFIGFTTVHPFTTLRHPDNGSSTEAPLASEDVHSQVDLDAVPDMTVGISILTDTRLLPSTPIGPLIPGATRNTTGPEGSVIQVRVGRKETKTTVYQMAAFHGDGEPF